MCSLVLNAITRYSLSSSSFLFRVRFPCGSTVGRGSLSLSVCSRIHANACVRVCVCVAFANEEFSVWRSSSPLLFLSLSFSRFSFVPFPIGHCSNPPRDSFTASFLPRRHRFRAPFRTLSPCRVDYYVPRNGSNPALTASLIVKDVRGRSMRRRSGLKKKARSTVSKKREEGRGRKRERGRRRIMNNNDDTNFNTNFPSESRLSRSLHLKVTRTRDRRLFVYLESERCIR